MFNRKIWDAIGNKKTCAYNLTSETVMLCKNKYNVTGYCDEFSCPLANTKYATVRTDNDKMYLYIKEPERIHTPKDKYEQILLSDDYETALKEIETYLEFWDEQIIHKCKQKMTKLYEYLERFEKLKETGKKKYIVRNIKTNRREKIRALKALNTANFEKEIGEELMKRLETGIYGEEAKEKYINAKEKLIKNRRKRYITDFEESSVDEAVKRKKNKKKQKQFEKNINW